MRAYVFENSLIRALGGIDGFPDYVCLVIHGVRVASETRHLQLWVLDIIVGGTFVIAQGFLRLALRERVHIVPIVTAGAHEQLDRLYEERYFLIRRRTSAGQS
jgi:hypothetical protein